MIANQIVSVQPMSLPSGLVFYMDYVFSADVFSLFDSFDPDKSFPLHAGLSLFFPAFFENESKDVYSKILNKEYFLSLDDNRYFYTYKSSYSVDINSIL
jgi:hypothetical protein